MDTNIVEGQLCAMPSLGAGLTGPLELDLDGLKGVCVCVCVGRWAETEIMQDSKSREHDRT